MSWPSREFDPAGSLGRLWAWNSGGRRREGGRISKAEYLELPLPHAGKQPLPGGDWLGDQMPQLPGRLVGDGLVGTH